MENGKTKKILTLTVVQEPSRVLLGLKKRGFGKGRWNGFGGKVGEGEAIEEAAKRELYEEAGISVENLSKVGILAFEFRGNPEILEVHIFKAVDWRGEPKESDEMMPRWFDIDSIPFNDMWPDDAHWFPLLLSGKKFTGRFLFGEGDAILEMQFEEANNL